tara:strand:+ start:10329 stop:10826 length:498 start_codon:yes stop_codon:yes gene_type:complete
MKKKTTVIGILEDVIENLVIKINDSYYDETLLQDDVDSLNSAIKKIKSESKPKLTFAEFYRELRAQKLRLYWCGDMITSYKIDPDGVLFLYDNIDSCIGGITSFSVQGASESGEYEITVYQGKRDNTGMELLIDIEPVKDKDNKSAKFIKSLAKTYKGINKDNKI